MLTKALPSSRTTSRDALDEKANPRFGGMPLGFEAGDANLYRYVKNSPTMFLDPSGLISDAEASRLVNNILNGSAHLRELSALTPPAAASGNRNIPKSSSDPTRKLSGAIGSRIRRGQDSVSERNRVATGCFA